VATSLARAINSLVGLRSLDQIPTTPDSLQDNFKRRVVVVKRTQACQMLLVADESNNTDDKHPLSFMNQPE